MLVSIWMCILTGLDVDQVKINATCILAGSTHASCSVHTHQAVYMTLHDLHRR